MATPVFPTLPSGMLPDSQQFTETAEDPAKREDMEGGYVVSRAKHTRKPRRTWGIGFRDLTDADKVTLDDFWDTVRGGSLILNWTHPKTSVVYAVRFKESMNWKYVGWGPRSNWDCSFTLEQA